MPIVSILLAATLSSSGGFKFFDLPGWMPTEVDSAHTFGSDPTKAGEEGWYLKEHVFVVTNSYISNIHHFKIFKIVETQGSESQLLDETDSRGQPRYIGEYEDDMGGGSFLLYEYDMSPSLLEDEDGWYIDPPRVYIDKEYGEGSAYIRNTKTGRIVLYLFRADDYETVREGYEAYTNVCRAARLDKDMYASLFSTFEGYMERLYHGSTPPLDYREMTGMRDTEFPWQYSPTNRVVSHRRLLDVDNVIGLGQEIQRMLNGGLKDSSTRCFLRREKWPAGISASNPIWWSSSAFQTDASEKIFPDIKWTDTITQYSLEKALTNGSIAVFANLAPSDDDDPVRMVVDGTTSPWSTLLDNARSYIFFEDIDEINIPPIKLPLSKHKIIDVITNAYPSSTPELIPTHRLSSTSLSTMNQILGLMDRTIHIPKIEMKEHTTTNIYASEMMYVPGFAKVKAHVTETGELEFESISSPEWRKETKTSTMSITNGTADIPSVYYSGARTIRGFGGKGTYPIEDLVVDESLLSKEIPSDLSDEERIFFHTNGMAERIGPLDWVITLDILNADGLHTGHAVNIPFSISPKPVEIGVQIDAYAHRSFSYQETIPGDYVDVGPMNSSGPIKTGKIALLHAIHEKLNDSDNYQNKTRLMSSSGQFSTHAVASNTVVSAWNTVMGELKTSAYRRTGGDPFVKWENIVACDRSIVSDFLSATPKEIDVSCSIDVNKDWKIDIFVEYENTSGEFEYVTTHFSLDDPDGNHDEYDDDGIPYFGSIDACADVSFSGEEKTLPEPEMYDARGYFSAMTVIDWNWNKIKRD